MPALSDYFIDRDKVATMSSSRIAEKSSENYGTIAGLEQAEYAGRMSGGNDYGSGDEAANLGVIDVSKVHVNL